MILYKKGGDDLQLVERHIIRKSNELYRFIDEYSFKVKNLYNYTNYIIREEFIRTSKDENIKTTIPKEYDLSKLLLKEEVCSNLMAQTSQQTIKLLYKNWKSFFVSIKDWAKNKDKYLGRPKPPQYKHKTKGRCVIIFTNQQCKLKDGVIKFPQKFNSWELKTKIKGNLNQVRIIPSNNQYVVEVVYTVLEKEKLKDNGRYLGIDLGIDNFATVGNNVGVKSIVLNGKSLKSINQYYNKQVAFYKPKAKKFNNLDITNRILSITNKRNNKINDYMHKYSRIIINEAIKLDCNTIVIGNNKEWKQDINMGSVTNQNFVSIPYSKFIDMVKYKCELEGISFVTTEESYTSGTSLLDDELPIKYNYNKSRRLKRGLFKSNKGILINADLNGACQIIKKVFPKAFADRIEGVALHPVRLKLAN